MTAGLPSRRLFLKQSAFGLGGAVLLELLPSALHAAHREAQAAAAAGKYFSFFTAPEAADVKAFAAQIFPTDDTPGANEANVVYFIDHVLANSHPEIGAKFRSCLNRLNDDTAQFFPGARFSTLTSDQQSQVISKFQTFVRKRRSDLMREIYSDASNPYEMLRTYVIAGFFSDPDNGGNKDLVGWELIGYDGMGAHEAPFGFYDAELLKGVAKK